MIGCRCPTHVLHVHARLFESTIASRDASEALTIISWLCHDGVCELHDSASEVETDIQLDIRVRRRPSSLVDRRYRLWTIESILTAQISLSLVVVDCWFTVRVKLWEL